MEYLTNTPNGDYYEQGCYDMANFYDSMYRALFYSNAIDWKFPPITFNDYSNVDDDFMVVLAKINLTGNPVNWDRWVALQFWAPTYWDPNEWIEPIADWFAETIWDAMQLKKSVEMPQWDFIYLKS